MTADHTEALLAETRFETVDAFYEDVARFSADLAAAYGETEEKEREWEERSGPYGEMRTHRRSWTEQNFYGGSDRPTVKILWGSGTNNYPDYEREATFRYLDETLTVGYDPCEDGSLDNITPLDGAPPDDLLWLAEVDTLVTKAYDWAALDGVSVEAAEALGDSKNLHTTLNDGQKTVETEDGSIVSQLEEEVRRQENRYEETQRLLEPPMAGIPLTTRPDELAERLEPVYGDAGTANQVAGRIVAQNPECFPAAEQDDS